MILFDEVVKTLHAAFPDIKIYGEQIPQNFCVPCFSVRVIQGGHSLMLDRRRQEHVSFDVRFFPADGLNACEQCRSMAETLKYVLEVISDNVTRGTNMEYNIVDQVLHFTFECNYFVRLGHKNDEKMEELEVHSGIES